MFVNRATVEEFAPLDLTLLIFNIVERKHLLVDVMVSRQHANQRPYLLRGGVFPVKQVEQHLKLLSVFRKGESWHFFSQEQAVCLQIFKHLQVVADEVVLDVLINCVYLIGV